VSFVEQPVDFIKDTTETGSVEQRIAPKRRQYIHDQPNGRINLAETASNKATIIAPGPANKTARERF
jgi:hypothetical protein